MKKRIVIANFKENLDWTNKLNVDFLIYKKDHDLSIDYNEILKSKNSNNVYYLRNTGRESHTYLIHIIKNYENLYDNEYFTQGNPFDHCPDYLDQINKDKNKYHHNVEKHALNCFSSKNGYITEHMHFQCEDQGGCETRNIWDMLFDYPPPDEVRITPFGMFMVTKEEIKMHKKEVYEKCLDLFKDGNINNKNAWSLEYFWGLLFNEIHTKHFKL